MKRLSSLAILLMGIVLHTNGQEINSRLPCSNAEAWQYTNEYSKDWEEIILCDLSDDPATWSWYYNYKSNKKGLQKIKVIRFWADEELRKSYLLFTLPNNINKYKLTLDESKNIMMEKVEGDMSKPYEKYYTKMF